MSPKDPQQDPTAAFDTTKRTSSPNKHKGRKIAVICGVFVVVVGAAAVWATSADDDKPNADKPLGDTSMGVSTPSPEKTFDGRYIKYNGTGFAPNMLVTLRCTNGKPTVTAQWLIRQPEQLLKDVVRTAPQQANKSDQCSWLLQVRQGVWYKEAVSYEDTNKGYWKIVEQSRNTERIHLIDGGSESITQVLIQDYWADGGAAPEQFYDLKAGNPQEGPDVLKLPKPPRNSSASPSPTATP
jgi:hypothetical protein